MKAYIITKNSFIVAAMFLLPYVTEGQRAAPSHLFLQDTSHCLCIPLSRPCRQRAVKVSFSFNRGPPSCLPGLLLCCDRQSQEDRKTLLGRIRPDTKSSSGISYNMPPHQTGKQDTSLRDQLEIKNKIQANLPGKKISEIRTHLPERKILTGTDRPGVKIENQMTQQNQNREDRKFHVEIEVATEKAMKTKIESQDISESFDANLPAEPSQETHKEITGASASLNTIAEYPEQQNAASKTYFPESSSEAVTTTEHITQTSDFELNVEELTSEKTPPPVQKFLTPVTDRATMSLFDDVSTASLHESPSTHTQSDFVTDTNPSITVDQTSEPTISFSDQLNEVQNELPELFLNTPISEGLKDQTLEGTLSFEAKATTDHFLNVKNVDHMAFIAATTVKPTKMYSKLDLAESGVCKKHDSTCFKKSGNESTSFLKVLNDTDFSGDTDNTEAISNTDDSEVLSNADNTEASSDTDNIEASSDTDNTEASSDTDDSKVLSNADNTETLNDSDNTEVLSDTYSTEFPSNADSTQASVNIDNTEVAKDTDNAEAASHTDKTEASSNADSTQASVNIDNTEASSATDKTEAASHTDNTEASSATDKTEAASHTDNTVASSDTDNTEASSDTDNTEASSDTDQTEASSDTDQTEASSDTDQTEASSDTDQTEASSDTDQIEASSDTDTADAVTKYAVSGSLTSEADVATDDINSEHENTYFGDNDPFRYFHYFQDSTISDLINHDNDDGGNDDTSHRIIKDASAYMVMEHANISNSANMSINLDENMPDSENTETAIHKILTGFQSRNETLTTESNTGAEFFPAVNIPHEAVLHVHNPATSDNALLLDTEEVSGTVLSDTEEVNGTVLLDTEEASGTATLLYTEPDATTTSTTNKKISIISLLTTRQRKTTVQDADIADTERKDITSIKPSVDVERPVTPHSATLLKGVQTATQNEHSQFIDPAAKIFKILLINDQTEAVTESIATLISDPQTASVFSTNSLHSNSTVQATQNMPSLNDEQPVVTTGSKDLHTDKARATTDTPEIATLKADQTEVTTDELNSIPDTTEGTPLTTEQAKVPTKVPISLPDTTESMTEATTTIPSYSPDSTNTPLITEHTTRVINSLPDAKSTQLITKQTDKTTKVLYSLPETVKSTHSVTRLKTATAIMLNYLHNRDLNADRIRSQWQTLQRGVTDEPPGTLEPIHISRNREASTTKTVLEQKVSKVSESIFHWFYEFF